MSLKIRHTLAETMEVTNLGGPNFRIGVRNIGNRELNLGDTMSG